MAHVTSIGLGETRGHQCPLYPEAGLLCNPGLTQAMGVSLICFSLFTLCFDPQSYAIWIRGLSIFPSVNHMHAPPFCPIVLSMLLATFQQRRAAETEQSTLLSIYTPLLSYHVINNIHIPSTN